MSMPSTKTIRSRCKCPGCSLWLRLEAERNDLSYKQKPVVAPVVETKKVIETVIVYKETKQSQARDLMFFNAGRYANGARDTAALLAQERLNEEMKQPND